MSVSWNEPYSYYKNETQPQHETPEPEAAES